MYYCKDLFDELDRLAADREGEVALIRELAARVVELAHSGKMMKIKQRWRDVLAMRQPDRPPVWCHGNASWNEIMPPEELVCQDPLCRELEEHFKRILVKEAIGDDTPVNDYYMINSVFAVTPENLWGLDIRHEASGADGGAWRYQPALATPEDFDKLVVPAYRVDAAATDERRERLKEILGDAMPVRVSPITGYNSIGTICSPAGHLRGMEGMMMDAVDSPELLHRLINTILQGEMARLNAIERSGAEILPNTDTPMLFSKGCRYQVVLREMQTLMGHMDRLREWTQISIEAVQD